VLWEWDALYSFLAGNIWTLGVLLLGLVGATLTAYAREQIRVGINWTLEPFERYLPWNRSSDFARPGLSADFTLVQLFLIDVAGKRARYEKTTTFVVDRAITSYQEGVTAERTATAFATMRGLIAETVKERGFYISTIDLGNVVVAGERLTNIFAADLFDSFVKPREHWTQEFTYPTKHLTLQVHFPGARPPKFIASKILGGALERPAGSPARLIDLYGQKSVVWDVRNPRPNEVLKLEWIW
jgi:hypothetical protein